MIRLWSMLVTVFLLTAGGCAGQRVWQSEPPAADLQTSLFEAQLRPVSPPSSPFFDGFQFTLVNRSQEPLWIDWARCRYWVDSQPRGIFVFEGLNPDTLRNPPAEEVGPGQRITKIIWPLGLLGWVPIKGRALDPNTSGFSPGVLPEGENGLLLIIGRGADRQRHVLRVTLTAHRR